MDWGNAIVRSKELGPSGEVISVTMNLHLEGDFKKTKKKITWLAEATETNPLPTVTLYDYDYLITKKKLEEDDNLADFVTPVTEFKEEAYADANILTLSQGDIMQFERKGYYVLDAINKEEKTAKFIKIPDGKASSLASKAGGAVPVDAVPASSVPKSKTPGKGSWGKGGAPQGVTPKPSTTDVPEGTQILLSEGTRGFEIPVKTTLHKVPRVDGESGLETPTNVALHKVKSIYESI